jgi:hypothetical protein
MKLPVDALSHDSDIGVVRSRLTVWGTILHDVIWGAAQPRRVPKFGRRALGTSTPTVGKILGPLHYQHAVMAAAQH